MCNLDGTELGGRKIKVNEAQERQPSGVGGGRPAIGREAVTRSLRLTARSIAPA